MPLSLPPFPPSWPAKGLPMALCLLCTLLASLALPLAGCRRPEPSAPQPAACVDQANLLNPQAEKRIQAQSESLAENYGIRLTTVILAEPAEDLDRKAVELFDALAAPDASDPARQLLLLIDPAGREVRLEIGYALEALFTDLFVARVEKEQMLPFFEQGLVGAGVEATVELLVGQIEREGAAGSATDQGGPLRHPSGGGGARIAAEIGGKAGLPIPKEKAARDYAPQPTPLETLRVYLEVLHARCKDPDLALYSLESRDFFRSWVVTDGQQANEERNLRAVLGQAESFVNGNLAVIRFPADERRTPPYFFQGSEAGWLLDFRPMHELIRFNNRNQWHFSRLDHPYIFAFADWRFDRHGFPLTEK